MNNIQEQIQKQIEEKIIKLSAVHGGDSHKSFIAKTATKKFFVKTSEQPTQVFHFEVSGLKSLQQAGVYTPTVQSFSQNLLVLNWLEQESSTTNFWISLGENLAHLHLQPAPFFGFFEDNCIGKASQKNLASDELKKNWPLFFWENRIDYKLKQIHSRHQWQLDVSEHQKLKDTILKLLNKKETKPSLVHGDLWSGNILCGPKQKPYLLDPAIYYGDRETDLAMTECFGGFSPDFYESYNKNFPLEEGYEQRKHIYNLYHILNHFLIFGENYKSTSTNLINTILYL